MTRSMRKHNYNLRSFLEFPVLFNDLGGTADKRGCYYSNTISYIKVSNVLKALFEPETLVSNILWNVL